jgi:hypothetical protein
MIERIGESDTENGNYDALMVGAAAMALMICESRKQAKCTRLVPFGYTANTLLPIRLLQREQMLSLLIFTNLFLLL